MDFLTLKNGETPTFFWYTYTNGRQHLCQVCQEKNQNLSIPLGVNKMDTNDSKFETNISINLGELDGHNESD